MEAIAFRLEATATRVEATCVDTKELEMLDSVAVAEHGQHRQDVGVID